MYVAWQQSPVKTRGGGPFLEGLAGAASPWRGLRCEHHGGGRVEWVPFVVEDDRGDGRLRQRLLFELPAIRSCCIADEVRRAAWWHDVDWAIRTWAEAGEGAFAADLARDRGAVVAEIRAVIPKPSPLGVREFAAFRASREAEDRARDEANRAYWCRSIPRDPSSTGGGAAGPATRPADCFGVLGLKPDAPLGRIKARHRSLVMQHHPDRGGDPARFREVQDAYERALAACERRSAANRRAD